MDDARMNLPESDQTPVAWAGDALRPSRAAAASVSVSQQFSQECRAVALDSSSGLALREAEIKRMATVGTREPTPARRKPVNQPWEITQAFGTKNLQLLLLCRLWHQSMLLQARSRDRRATGDCPPSEFCSTHCSWIVAINASLPLRISRINA